MKYPLIYPVICFLVLGSVCSMTVAQPFFAETNASRVISPVTLPNGSVLAEYPVFASESVEYVLPAQHSQTFAETLHSYEPYGQPVQSSSISAKTNITSAGNLVPIVSANELTFLEPMNTETQSKEADVEMELPASHDYQASRPSREWPAFPQDDILQDNSPQEASPSDFPAHFSAENASLSQTSIKETMYRGQTPNLSEQLERAYDLPPPIGKGPNLVELPPVLTQAEEPPSLPHENAENPPASSAQTPPTPSAGNETDSVHTDSAQGVNGFLLIATIVSTVGCILFVVLAFDYYQRWMQSLMRQGENFALNLGEESYLPGRIDSLSDGYSGENV